MLLASCSRTADFLQIAINREFRYAKRLGHTLDSAANQKDAATIQTLNRPEPLLSIHSISLSPCFYKTDVDEFRENILNVSGLRIVSLWTSILYFRCAGQTGNELFHPDCIAKVIINAQRSHGLPTKVTIHNRGRFQLPTVIRLGFVNVHLAAFTWFVEPTNGFLVDWRPNDRCAHSPSRHLAVSDSNRGRLGPPQVMQHDFAAGTKKCTDTCDEGAQGFKYASFTYISFEFRGNRITGQCGSLHRPTAEHIKPQRWLAILLVL